MVKSFKKAIACALAVVMVAFSVPFTALADGFDPNTVSSYHPDLEIQFGAFYDLNEGTFESPTTANKDSWWNYGALYGPPVVATYTKDTTAGGISITKLEQKASLSGPAATQATAALGDPVAAINYDYATGDFFTATFVLKNVNQSGWVSFALDYSNNIEPAGCWKVSRTSYKVGAVSANTGDYEWVAGGPLPDTNWSAELYGGGFQTQEDSDLTNNRAYIVAAAPYNVNGANFSAPSNPEGMTFINPETGAANYAYTDSFIVATVVFKIVGDFDASHPITFAPNDPQNTGFTQAYEGGSYACLDPKPKNYASYAEDTASPASEQFTFFGMNINSGEGTGGGTHEHSYTWVVTTPAVAATCTTAGATAIETGTCECGDTQTRGGEVIPATGHDWGEWTVTTAAVAPTCTEAGANAIETRVCANDSTHVETRGGEVVPAAGHNYGSVVTAPTCTEPGYTTYTCSVCGDSYTGDNVPASGHNWGEWTEVSPEVPATEESTGTTAVEQRVCANDPTHVETRGGEVIPVLEHTHVPGAAADENVVEATCTTDGSYDTVVRCTKCGEIISSEHHVVAATGLGSNYSCCCCYMYNSRCRSYRNPRLLKVRLQRDQRRRRNSCSRPYLGRMDCNQGSYNQRRRL